jgi:HEPN domain-containing protein
LDDAEFQSLLEQVRELHRLTDEVTREQRRIHENVRARLSWDERNAPPLPQVQREIADEAVEALSRPRLSPSQSKTLQRVFFGR